MGLRKPLAASPLLVRVAPFVVFLALTVGQGQFGEASRYWFYLAKTLVGVWLIWEMRPFVSEMRWAVSWEAVVVGVAYSPPGLASAGNGRRRTHFGQSSA